MDYTEGQTMDVPGAVLISHTPAAMRRQPSLYDKQTHPNSLKSC